MLVGDVILSSESSFLIHGLPLFFSSMATLAGSTEMVSYALRMFFERLKETQD